VIDVDLEALDRRAREVAMLGEDLQTSVARWRAVLTTPCAPSVAAVRDAYTKDFSLYAEVLRSWAESARTAAATYEATDDESMDTQ